MRIVYQEAERQNGSCLLSPIDILEKIPLDIPFEEDELDQTLRNLEIDEYFDVIRSDKKGELVYCINMQKKVCSLHASSMHSSLISHSK